MVIVEDVGKRLSNGKSGSVYLKKFKLFPALRMRLANAEDMNGERILSSSLYPSLQSLP